MAEIEFVPSMQMKVRVHNYDLRDWVLSHGTEVKYVQRPLLGVNCEVENAVRETLLYWLAS